MMVDLNCRVRLSPDVLFQTLDGETVLLDVKNGKYYGMDAVGTRLWSLLGELGEPAQVVARMRTLYAADEAQLERSVLRWIELLAARGLLTVEPPASHAEVEAA